MASSGSTPTPTATKLEDACKGIYDVQQEYAGKLDKTDPVNIAKVATALVDATGNSPDFASLRTASELVAQVAVDPSAASEEQVEAYVEAGESWETELDKVDAICGAQ